MKKVIIKTRRGHEAEVHAVIYAGDKLSLFQRELLTSRAAEVSNVDRYFVRFLKTEKFALVERGHALKVKQ